jgi:Glycosyl hydrolases family 43
MRHSLWNRPLKIFAASFILACAHYFCHAAATNDFKPGAVWLDTSGKPINAHGGGMLFYRGVYYWYGENKEGRTWMPACNKSWDGYRVEVTGIRCYSSKNLLDWQDEGLVLPAVSNDPASDLHPSKVCERPKVVFNPQTKKFVMWMHVDNMDYTAARAGVAVADQPTGPFIYLGSIRPDGQESRDQTLFQDDDGKAYRTYACETNHTTCISLLTDDYLKPAGKCVRVFVNDPMEAQVIFKHAGKYWLLASHVTGWDPNPARAAVADSIWGPWVDLGNPCFGPGATNTFGAQSAFVFPVAGKDETFIFMADQWNKTNLPDSRYIWLPIQFADKGLQIPWQASWRLNTDDSRKTAAVSTKPAFQVGSAN